MSTVKRYQVPGGAQHERKRDAEQEAKAIAKAQQEAWLESAKRARGDHERTLKALKAAGEPTDNVGLAIPAPPPTPEVETVELEEQWRVVQKPTEATPQGATLVGPTPDRDLAAKELERLQGQVGGEGWRGPRVELELEEILVPAADPVD